ncbi:hypothetical protein [Ornithinimicrobium sp. LYQ121]|uniref:hypothetical protein n=1 Tax=Ornithinimicrobium sp. LYQ121 TaxID=3378801 RepID=UPI0038620AA6
MCILGGEQGRGRYPLARPFPRPGALIALAYRELDIVLVGDGVQRTAIGDLDQLIRPWDPGSIEDPPVRKEQWLEAVVDCVHEIAVLADRRHRAGHAVASDALEEWHRYALPAFFDRRRTQVRTGCDSRHHNWPARPAHIRFQDDSGHRENCYTADVDHHRQGLEPPAYT